jgi:hypothetical protein
MDKTIQKLLELREILEKATALLSPKMPKIPGPPKVDALSAPKQPDLTPTSKKDPTKVAQQMEDPDAKTNALKMAKQKLILAKNGQWSLDEEPMDKGIKTAIAGAVLAGSSLLPMKAAAAPIKAAVTPTAQTYDVLDHGNGEKSTLNTRSYGPYKVTTMLQPSSSPGKSSTELTHQVQFVGEAHSPEHAKALAAELKGSGIDHKQIMGLKGGEDLMSSKGASHTGPASKPTKPLWNK